MRRQAEAVHNVVVDLSHYRQMHAADMPHAKAKASHRGCPAHVTLADEHTMQGLGTFSSN